MFQFLPELNYLLFDLENAIKQGAICKDIEALYERNINKYPKLSRYSVALGTNDNSKQYFNTDITNILHKSEFIDDNLKITINHQWLDFSNIIYLSKNHKYHTPIFDSTVSIDTNSMNFIDKFYRTLKINDFLKLKIKYNIDMNYLPYIFEDHINPYKDKYIKKHKNNTINYEKEREIRERKIRNFEIINNIDKTLYEQNHIIEFDKNLLLANGYKSFEEYYQKKLFYFNNFFDFSDANVIKLPKNTIFFDSSKRIEINHIFHKFNLFYGYVLQIVIEKFKGNTNTIENKIHNIQKNMFLNGQQLTQILYFAYNYFINNEEFEINKFFNFDKSWNYEKILEKAYNITWDIFHYSINQEFLTNPSRIINGKPFKADLGIPMFLTEDNKFFSSYIKLHSIQFYIIDERSEGRPFYSVSNSTYNNNEFNNYLLSFIDKHPNIDFMKQKRFKLFKTHNHIYSIFSLFKDKMEIELKEYIQKI